MIMILFQSGWRSWDFMLKLKKKKRKEKSQEVPASVCMWPPSEGQMGWGTGWSMMGVFTGSHWGQLQKWSQVGEPHGANMGPKCCFERLGGEKVHPPSCFTHQNISQCHVVLSRS